MEKYSLFKYLRDALGGVTDMDERKLSHVRIFLGFISVELYVMSDFSTKHEGNVFV